MLPTPWNFGEKYVVADMKLIRSHPTLNLPQKTYKHVSELSVGYAYSRLSRYHQIKDSEMHVYFLIAYFRPVHTHFDNPCTKMIVQVVTMPQYREVGGVDSPKQPRSTN